MRWDGDHLPDPVETAVLGDLGVIGSEQLPSLAARWLAADLVDTEAVRELAGENPRESWSLHQLMKQVLDQIEAVVPSDSASRRRVLLEWVTSRWLVDHDTRRAVETLAWLNRSEPDLGLGEFGGLESEWHGGWGRPIPEVEADAEETLHALREGL